jgi:hypothetical protein
MKGFPAILFFSGLAIQLASLLGEHAPEIPFVIKVIAPSYQHARTRIETLLRQRKLLKTNEGFSEISQFLIWNVYEVNQRPKDLKTDLKVESISEMGEFLSMGTSKGDVQYTTDDIRYTVSSATNLFQGNQHSLEFLYHLKALQDQVDDLKRPSVLRFCFGMFFVGALVEIVAFLLESAEASKIKKVGDCQKEHPLNHTRGEDQKPPA